MTPKQARFVLEYLKDLNATQAAIRSGYSPKTAEQQGYQLLQKTSVSATIAAKQAVHAAKAGLTVDRIVQGLLREAESVGENSTQSARVAAWAHLGKHLGMFSDKIGLDATMAVRSMTDEELAECQTALLAEIGVKKA